MCGTAPELKACEPALGSAEEPRGLAWVQLDRQPARRHMDPHAGDGGPSGGGTIDGGESTMAGPTPACSCCSPVHARAMGSGDICSCGMARASASRASHSGVSPGFGQWQPPSGGGDRMSRVLAALAYSLACKDLANWQLIILAGRRPGVLTVGL